MPRSWITLLQNDELCASLWSKAASEPRGERNLKEHELAMLNHSQTGNEHQKQMENMIALVDNLANDIEEYRRKICELEDVVKQDV